MRKNRNLYLSSYEKDSDDSLKLDTYRLNKEIDKLTDLKGRYVPYTELIEKNKLEISKINTLMINDFNRNARITARDFRELIFLKRKEVNIEFDYNSFLTNAKKITNLYKELFDISNILYFEGNYKFKYKHIQSNELGLTWFSNIYVQVEKKTGAKLTDAISYQANEFDCATPKTNRMIYKFKESYHGPNTPSIQFSDDYAQQIDLKIEDNYKILRKIELIQRSRKKQQEKADNIGHIYVMSNEAYPDIYKIGSTYGLPEERAEELTGTGNLYPFIVEHSVEIKDAEYYEKQIHKILDKSRVNKNREFFKLPLDEIKNIFKHLEISSIHYLDKLTLAEIKQAINYD